MTIKEFEIVFDKPKNDSFYLVGDTLVGKVIVSTEKGKLEDLKKLQIKFTGKATNSWLEERPNKKLVEILEEDEYLNFEAEVNLDGNSKSERSEFGFEYELTDGLPPSFKGTYGSITYAVSATLFKLQDSLEATQTITKEFLVEGNVDLNSFPQASQSSEVKLSQALLFENGLLGMEANIHKSGYVPGEVINFHSNLSNESNKNVNASLQLIQETIFHAKERQVSDIAVIANVPGPILKPHTTETWSGDLLKVPSLPPSVFENCDIISVQYRLVIEMEVPDPNINLEGAIPIMIGTKKIEKEIGPHNEHEGRSNNEIATNGSASGASVHDEDKPSEHARPGIRKYRTRQNRPQTTCLVFRKDRPRQKLPTPMPETWKKPAENPSSKPLIHDTRTDESHDINPTDLTHEVTEVLTLKDGENGAVHFAPAFPGNTEHEKPKFPENYIRRGYYRNNSPGSRDPNPNANRIPKDKNVPPRKPERKITKSDSKNDIPSFPGAIVPLNTASGIVHESVEVSPPSYTESCGKNKSKDRHAHHSPGNAAKKGTLPYPKETNISYPLPDYSFNVFVDGQRRDAIGWNITRNTLSLKRAKVAAGFVLPLPTVGWSSDPPVPSDI